MLALTIETGVDQVAPPSTVFENIGRPRNANEWPAPMMLMLSQPGRLPRIQVAYALPAPTGARGSAVMDCLSLKKIGSLSVIRRTGSPQLAPPSGDVDTSTPEKMPLADTMPSEIWYALPAESK